MKNLFFFFFFLLHLLAVTTFAFASIHRLRDVAACGTVISTDTISTFTTIISCTEATDSPIETTSPSTAATPSTKKKKKKASTPQKPSSSSSSPKKKPASSTKKPSSSTKKPALTPALKKPATTTKKPSTIVAATTRTTKKPTTPTKRPSSSSAKISSTAVSTDSSVPALGGNAAAPTPCTPHSVCVDAINSCRMRYGGCYDTCAGAFTALFTPPPCPTANAKRFAARAQGQGAGVTTYAEDVGGVMSAVAGRRRRL